MKTQVMEDKPDFDKIARDTLGTSTSYGRCDAPIGSSLRSYYETEVKGMVTGMDYMYKSLQSELSSAQEKNRKLELETLEKAFECVFSTIDESRERLLKLISEIENKKV